MASYGSDRHIRGVKLPLPTSLTLTQQFAPAEFRRWALTGISVGLSGYVISLVLNLVMYGPASPMIPRLVLFTCVQALSLVLAAKGREVLGGIIALTGTWLELHIAFMLEGGFPPAGMVVMPGLIFTIGLLLGARAAGITTVVTIATTTLANSISPSVRASGTTPEVITWHVLYVIAMLMAWAMVGLSLKGFARVFDEMTAKERDLADLIRFSPDGILLLDGERRVLIANPAAESILDISVERIVGRTVDALLLEATRAANVVDAASLLPQDTGAHPVAIELTSKNGSTVHVEATWRRMEGDRRQLLLRDVSERMRAEAQRRAMEKHLAHAQRLEAVGQLAGSISHDFNNILTAMGGSAELLRDETNPQEQVELVDEILAARDRGATLTRQLLAFARREAIQMRVVDIAEIVRGMERLLQRVVGEQHRLEMRLAVGCRVRIDVAQLEQAVVNLVSNARDAMPSGGTCTISVERSTDAARAAWVRLHVTDDGAGMAAEVAAQAFEPFFTTKARGQGTGLGLASVHGSALRFGGTARIQSALGVGTRVTLELPEVDEAPDEAVGAPLDQTYRPGPFSILLAEDDPAARSIVERMLRRVGYDVHLAGDGVEAVHLVEDHGLRPDLVLTDVMMPGLTGPEVARRIHVQQPEVPVLFMSGYAEEAIGDLGTQRADRDLITKPFSSASLLARISELLKTTV